MSILKASVLGTVQNRDSKKSTLGFTRCGRCGAPRSRCLVLFVLLALTITQVAEVHVVLKAQNRSDTNKIAIIFFCLFSLERERQVVTQCKSLEDES